LFACLIVFFGLFGKPVLRRDEVIQSEKIQQRLISILLQLVRAERSREVIDRALVRAITQMLVDCSVRDLALLSESVHII
jgi:hypothetical protein